MKRWYKFWKKSGPMQSYDESYKLLEDHDSEDVVKSKVERWAETVGGGFNTHYSYGWERVEVPPEDWLKNKVGYMKSNIEETTKKMKEYTSLLRKYYGNKRYFTKLRNLK